MLFRGTSCRFGAFDRRTGDSLWTYRLDTDKNWTAGEFATAGDRVYLSYTFNTDVAVVMLNAADGQQKARWLTRDPLVPTISRLYASGDTLYAGGDFLSLSGVSMPYFGRFDPPSISSAPIAPRPRDEAATVYPNPASSVVTMLRREERPTTIRIVDALGRERLRAEISGRRSSILLDGLPDGTYFILNGSQATPFILAR